MVIKSVRETVEDIIRSYLPTEKYVEYDPNFSLRSELIPAMRYAMEAGGKRIRPTIMYLTYLSLGGRDEKLIGRFMAALEMIHTHSLIHDDLPALDDDSLRRGRPTVHVAYNESTAILAGDALLNYAYEVALGACDEAEVQDDPEVMRRVLGALKILAKYTGIGGMLGGQGLDVAISVGDVSEEDIIFIHKRKTCKLIQAAFVIGAILAGSDWKVLDEAGELIGEAFQMQDDILDVIGDTETLGKEVHQDERNEKKTRLSFISLKEAEAQVGLMTDRAVPLIESVIPDNTDRSKLISFLVGLTSRNN